MALSAPRQCDVLKCQSGPFSQENPPRIVERHPEGTLRRTAGVCSEHWLKIDAGEPWLWVEGPSRRGGVHSKDPAEGTTQGVILMGDDLAEHRLLTDVSFSLQGGSVHSPQLSTKSTMILELDGRVFGTNEHTSVRLHLTDELMSQLARALPTAPES